MHNKFLAEASLEYSYLKNPPSLCSPSKVVNRIMKKKSYVLDSSIQKSDAACKTEQKQKLNRTFSLKSVI
jgi:hypothetical protein